MLTVQLYSYLIFLSVLQAIHAAGSTQNTQLWCL